MTTNSTRRAFLGCSLGAAAWGFAGCSSEPDAETREAAPVAATPTKMRLSLSVRVAEKFDNKEESSLTIEQLIELARTNGYAALCMRASQAGIHTAPETVREMSGKIHGAGLAVSMVTGDFAVPRNDDHGPDGLRNITPYLDLAEAFQSSLIRVCMKKDEDIEWAQKAADEAKERGIRLAHQAHDASMFETVDGSLEVLRKVGRENFGLIYEPANWMIADEDYGRSAIERIQDYIFNVYVQNHLITPGGSASVNTWKKGPVRLNHIGLWEQGGVRFEEVFEALRAIGYEDYVTVHQAFEGVMSVDEAAKKSADYLRTLVA